VNAEAFQNFALVLEKVITKFLCVTLFRGLKAAILTEKLQKAGYDLNYLFRKSPIITALVAKKREENPDDIDQWQRRKI
jgi:hypothetical protein